MSTNHTDRWMTPYECVEREVARLRRALVERAMKMEEGGMPREEIRRQLGVPAHWCWRNLPKGGANGKPGRKPRIVPDWVPEGFRDEYRRRATTYGDQAAARWARQMKQKAAA